LRFLSLDFPLIGLKPYFDSVDTKVETISSVGFSEGYKVIDFKINGIDSSISKIAWKRVFLHPRSYFIIENNQEEFSDYELEVATNSKQLIINNKTVLNYHLQENGNLKLIGIWNKEAVVAVLAPINHKEMPLMKGQFHWVID